MSPKAIRAMFERFEAATPEPTTELEYGNPFQLLVAVILSAQATDKGVNLATRALFHDAPGPHEIAALGEAGLTPYIKTIGLYPAKAKHIVAMARLLLERHGGKVPEDHAALTALPGVGPKTANVILNTAFRQAVIPVDTHVFRVANRTGLAPGANVKTVERMLLKSVPAEYLLHAHHWLLLHGRYVCKARKPECYRCLIRDLCQFPDKTPPPR